MTRKNLLWDQAPGTAATQATLGSTEPPTRNGGGTISHETAFGRTNTGLRFDTKANQTNAFPIAFVAASTFVQVTFELVTPAAAPSAALTLMQLRSSVGRVLSVLIGATGNLATSDAGGNGVQIAPAVGWSTRLRISLVIEVGATTSTGKITAKAYPTGSTAPLATGVNVTNANLGTAAISTVQLGDTGPAAIFGFDELQMNDGAGTEIPTYVTSNTPPTVSAGANQTSIATGSTVTVAATASDAEGPVTYAWTWAYHPNPAYVGANTGISNAGAATATFPSGSSQGVLYILRCTVTDAGGLTASATVEVRVPRTGSANIMPLPMDRTDSSGVWLRVGATATDGGTLANDTDTDFLESPDLTSTETWFEVRAEPRGPIGAGSQFDPVRLSSYPADSTCTARVRLMQGTTVIAGPYTATITSTITDYEFPALTSGQAALVSDAGNLRFRVGGLV